MLYRWEDHDPYITGLLGPLIVAASLPSAAVSVVNSAAETTLLDAVVGAGSLGASGVLGVVDILQILNNTGAGVGFTFRFYVNGALIYSTGSVNFGSDPTVNLYKHEWLLANADAAHQVLMHKQDGALVAAGAAPPVGVAASRMAWATAAIDSTQAMEVKITVQMTVAAANASVISNAQLSRFA